MATLYDLATDEYRVTEVTVSGASVSKGDFIVLNSTTIGFYITDGAIGDVVAVAYQGDIVKAVGSVAWGVTIAQNAPVYITPAGEIAATTTGNRYAGIALSAIGSTDTTAYISFNGENKAVLA